MVNIFTDLLKKMTTVTKYINISVFLFAFLLGLVYIYCFDYNRKVEVYPTPYNIDKVEYKDEAENCFSYKVKDVTCPSDKATIAHLPIT